MSKWAKMSWLVSGLALTALLAVRFVLGGWVPYLWVPFGIFAIGLIAAIVVDFRFYLEFFSLKTTKHGLNMGTMILLGLVILVSVNVLAVKRDKTWDLTEEKLFSLSDQSRDIVKGLSDELKMIVFYRGAKDQQVREQLKQTTDLYEAASNRVSVRFVDAFVERAKAQEYLAGLGDITDAVFFVEYKGKKVRVESPFDEEKTTAAIIKATREGKKKVYFLVGHGERNIDSEDPEGAREFKNALVGAAFEVGTVNLLETGKVPEDARVLAIIGPTTQIQDSEFDLIRNFARSGGSLFIAADPGLRHQIQLLTKTIGVEFLNNFIINDRIQIIGRGGAAALGMLFDQMHPITKAFRTQNFTLFDVSSEVLPAQGEASGLTRTEIVRTPPVTWVANDLKPNMKPTERRAVTVGVAVSGKLPGATGGTKDAPQAEETKEFRAVVFGDSDFVAQKDILQGLNMDLAMNAMAYLADENDLISIRPKQPAGTKMELTAVKQNTFVIAGVALPLVLFVLGGTIWYRRRSA